MTPVEPRTMNAWVVRDPGPIEDGPLDLVTKPVPTAGPGELLVRVDACGVCRTDLHVAEGDLPVRREHVTPGHEVVATVAGLGPDTADAGIAPGERVGVAWLRSTCGQCRFCRRGAENLCPYSHYTGWDADGGYAEYATVPAAFAYRLPAGYTDAELAPLLCAGIIGYRALEKAAVPEGGTLGVYGFGGSAHLATQVALARGATVHVMTRGEQARQLALSLGAASASDAYDDPPEKLDSAILFAPAGALVPVALRALDRGGILAIAGIHLTDVPSLVYETDLFYERQVRSVTANTRADGEAFLGFAAEHHLQVTAHEYPMRQADRALQDLDAGRFDGAAVLVTEHETGP